MQTLSSQLLPFLLYLPFSSLTSISHSLFLCIQGSPVWAPFTGFLLKPGKKPQRQQLDALFSRAGIEGLGALCMSEPHSSGSIQHRFPLRYSVGLYFVKSKEAQRKKEGSPLFFLCPPRSRRGLPKLPLMRWPPPRCEAGLWKRKGLINMGPFSSPLECHSRVHSSSGWFCSSVFTPRHTCFGVFGERTHWNHYIYSIVSWCARWLVKTHTCGII